MRRLTDKLELYKIIPASSNINKLYEILREHGGCRMIKLAEMPLVYWMSNNNIGGVKGANVWYDATDLPGAQKAWMSIRKNGVLYPIRGMLCILVRDVK